MIGLLCAVTVGGSDVILDELIFYWMLANGILGAPNMIPFGPLDGKKIRTWSVPIFWIWLIICVSMVWFNLTQLSAFLG